VVDDGSPGDGAVVAKEFSARDPRFRLVQQGHRGLGPARNAGAELARGEYLTFVGPHDVIPSHAYELLIGSLEASGSELACGNVFVLDAGQTRQHGSFTSIVGSAGQRLHLNDRPELLGDINVWNKVFRRDFWTSHGLAFGESTNPDLLVALRSQALAASRDVLEAAVCFRRRNREPVIQRHDVADLQERLGVMRSVLPLLETHAPQAVPYFQRHLVRKLINRLIDAIPRASAEDQRLLLETGGEFLAGIELAELPALERLRFHLLRRRMLPELLELTTPPVRTGLAAAPVVRRRGLIRSRWYAQYPYFKTFSRRIPRHLYEVTDELRLIARVDGVSWQNGLLRIEGHAYLDRVDLSSAQDSKLRIWLHDAARSISHELPIDRVRRSDVTADSRQPTACHDWSGFVAEIDPALLRGKKRAGGKKTDWTILAQVDAHGLTRTGTLEAPARPQARWLMPREFAGNLEIRCVARDTDFFIRVSSPKAQLNHCGVTDGILELAGSFRARAGTGVKLVATNAAGSEVCVDAELTPPAGFRALLPLDRLEVGIDQQAISWDFALEEGDKQVRLMPAATIGECRVPLGGGRELALTHTAFGNLRGLQRVSRPVVTDAEWTANGLLRLAGDHSSELEHPAHLILRHLQTTEEYHVELAWAGNRFVAEFAPSAIAALGAIQPMAPGTWELFTGTDEDEVALAVERRTLAALPDKRVIGVHELDFLTGAADGLRLRIQLARAEDERGTYRQARLRDRDYPRYRSLPVRDLVVFDSYMSRQYSCNPRAIFEELGRQGTDLECLWISRHGQFNVPAGGRTVLLGSREHYEAMARARYVVSNEAQPAWFRKRADQTYLQCWHGTPLKKLGVDVPGRPDQRKAVEDWITREVTQWDVLLSPNPFTTPIMRQAYRYDGEVLETGYPRNDLLNSPDRDRIAAEVRGRLGIPPGKKVVLYVPTWRDDRYIGPGRRAFELAFDLDRARAALGGDHILLLRTHYLVTDRLWSEADDFVVDVSRYPDIAELYLIADVLVTDYSSAMFDFAVTGRPMLFFTYDLEHYRDTVRGFYFDFEEHAPGPLLRTSDEVISALRDLPAVTASFEARYAAFVTRFCPFDDGHAAERAIRRLLNG
jgi:CDP-glycerol glycerophosphotransferase